MDVRLQKVLQRAGLASRRKAEEFILAGRVEVNGHIVRELGTKVEPGRDLVRVDGRLLEDAQRRVYYVLFKPEGVVTTFSDPQGRRTVGDLVAHVGERLFAVGRLDYDAQGALILTNDGDLAHRLMHPRFRVPRTYLAKVRGEPDAAALARLREGVLLEDGPARPELVELHSRAPRNTWVRVVLREGRPHLVKRMFAAVGFPVLRLFRPDFAGITVEGLRPGHHRPLSPEEIARLRSLGGPGEMDAPTVRLGLPPRRHGRASDRARAAAPEAKAGGALAGRRRGKPSKRRGFD